MNRFLLPFLLILFLIAGCQEKSASGRYMPGEIIVGFSEGAFDSQGKLVSDSLIKLNERYKIYTIEQLFNSVYLLKFPEETDMKLILEEYKNDSTVKSAELNYQVRANE